MISIETELKPARILILGGMGPKAGVDLHAKIIDSTKTRGDHQHLSICHLSFPGEIPDRLSFLSDPDDKPNPAYEAANLAKIYSMEENTAVGIACNTMHAKAILDPFLRLIEPYPYIRFVHIIEETADWMRLHYPYVKNIGVLCSLGAYRSHVFEEVFSLKHPSSKILFPSEELIENEMHFGIYHQTYGVKARSAQIDPRVQLGFQAGIEDLIDKGAETVILGCTEMPLAITKKSYKGIPLIDSTQILAEALIRTVYMPWQQPLRNLQQFI